METEKQTDGDENACENERDERNGTKQRAEIKQKGTEKYGKRT